MSQEYPFWVLVYLLMIIALTIVGTVYVLPHILP